MEEAAGGAVTSGQEPKVGAAPIPLRLTRLNECALVSSTCPCPLPPHPKVLLLPPAPCPNIRRGSSGSPSRPASTSSSGMTSSRGTTAPPWAGLLWRSRAPASAGSRPSSWSRYAATTWTRRQAGCNRMSSDSDPVFVKRSWGEDSGSPLMPEGFLLSFADSTTAAFHLLLPLLLTAAPAPVNCCCHSF